MEKITDKNDKKQTKPTKKADKTPTAIYFDAMAAMLNHTHPSLPWVPERFHLIRISSQQDEIVEEVGGVCQLSSRERVAQAIIRHAMGALAGRDHYAWEHQKVMSCVRHWESVTKARPRPAYFRFKSEPGLTFRRLPFDLPEGFDKETGSDCPLFMELLSRMTNATAFTAWLGSLFYPDSDRQQYVWMYGEGQNGKGSVAELIRYLFGDAYYAATPPSRDDKFWSYFLVNKRVVCFPDCNDNKFITSGFFKSLTGGDAVKVEKKGGGAFTVRLDCKYIINSNDKPDISGSTADRRRAIYCELQDIRTEPDPGYIAKLKAEAPAILAHAMAHYRENYHDGSRIKVDQDVMDELIEENEDSMQALFNNFFVRCGAGDGIRAHRMNKILENHFHQAHALRKFKKYVKRHPWVEYKTARLIGGKPEKCYVGIREARDGKNVNVISALLKE